MAPKISESLTASVEFKLRMSLSAAARHFNQSLNILIISSRDHVIAFCDTLFPLRLSRVRIADLDSLYLVWRALV